MSYIETNQFNVFYYWSYSCITFLQPSRKCICGNFYMLFKALYKILLILCYIHNNVSFSATSCHDDATLPHLYYFATFVYELSPQQLGRISWNVADAPLLLT